MIEPSVGFNAIENGVDIVHENDSEAAGNGAHEDSEPVDMIIHLSGMCQPAIYDVTRKYLCWAWVAFEETARMGIPNQLTCSRTHAELLPEEDTNGNDTISVFQAVLDALNWTQEVKTRFNSNICFSLKFDNSSVTNLLEKIWETTDQSVLPYIEKCRKILDELPKYSITTILRQFNYAVPLVNQGFLNATTSLSGTSKPTNSKSKEMPRGNKKETRKNSVEAVPASDYKRFKTENNIVYTLEKIPEISKDNVNVKSKTEIDVFQTPDVPKQQNVKKEEKEKTRRKIPFPDLNSLQPSETKPPKSKKKAEQKEPNANGPKIYNSPNKLPYLVVTVPSPEEFKKLVNYWEGKIKKNETVFSWGLHYSSKLKTEAKDQTLDDEMYTFLPNSQFLHGIAISFDPNLIFFVKLSPSNSPEMLNRWAEIRKLMENEKLTKVCFSVKNQLKILLDHGIEIKEGIWDPKIAAWVLDSQLNRDKTLGQMFEELVREKRFLGFLAGGEGNGGDVDRTFVAVYQGLMLMKRMAQQFEKKPKEYELFVNVEMRITPILAKMEHYGIGFEKSTFIHHKDMINMKLQNLEARAYKAAGKEFSLTSLVEIGKTLFEDMRIPYPFTPPKNKRWSTKQEILNALVSKYPIAKIILEHRKLMHTINTYIDPLPKYSFWSDKLNMHRIYSTSLQTAVPTGRLAFIDPNLQSIAKSFKFTPIKNPDQPLTQSPTCSPVVVNIRDSFVSAEGFTFISADYSQLELRIMAHFSRDEILISSLCKPNNDIFCEIASTWKQKSISEVTVNDRNQTKQIIYGILYGMGPKSLAMELEVSKAEAQKLIETFNARYSAIHNYIQFSINYCKSNGFVETILGRRRYFGNIYSTAFREKSAAERQAVNTISQGSAADIAKKAMIDVEDYISKHNSKARLVLQMHDELLYEVPLEESKQFMEKLKHLMENAVKLSVPLPVRVYAGHQWGSLELVEV
eukprot:TRINITY_DN7229_c0_g2_i1.p1 TRINITY_DN7229_c0_g2~~TRINITY_DN7229_c0_g2_i1.p1  ORF type:complete len:1068 (-),score=314.05 TRINITY_DN7229_c0_g2_i1:20-2920(-)